MMHRRREFSKETKRAAFTRSNGICECHLIPHVFEVACGLPLGNGNTFYEHIDPDAMSSRNDIGNIATLTKTCWKLKTATYDIPTVAKSNRVRDAAWGIKKPRTITAWRNMRGERIFAGRER